MTITTPVYATRGDVKNALDSKETARNNAQIDQAIESASRQVEGLLHRTFYPAAATKYFDWPNYQYADPWRLWLDQNEVVSVTSLVSGSSTISPANYYLEPANDGPPYDRIEINLGGQGAFSSGTSSQRAITVTGTFGWPFAALFAGALVGTINSSVTTLVTSDGSSLDVGSLALIDSERVLVTGRSFAASAQTLQTNLTAAQNGTTVAVATGSAFVVGEDIQIDSETMRVVWISGNNLTVIRAWDGSVLASHSSGTTIYVSRTFTVARGVTGTTAASHNDAAAITAHQAPSLVRELAIAEALNYLIQRSSGYARTVGSGDNAIEYGGRSLTAVRQQALAAFGRQMRMRAV